MPFTLYVLPRNAVKSRRQNVFCCDCLSFARPTLSPSLYPSGSRFFSYHFRSLSFFRFILLFILFHFDYNTLVNGKEKTFATRYT